MTNALQTIFGNRLKALQRQTIDVLCDGDERDLYLLDNWSIFDYYFNMNEMVTRPPNQRKTISRGE